MKLSELINKSQKLLDTFGDLEVFDDSQYEVTDINFRMAEADEFPDDWEMPEGYTWAEAGVGR